MRDNRVKYDDCWFEDKLKYKYRFRRNVKRYERDMSRLTQE